MRIPFRFFKTSLSAFAFLLLISPATQAENLKRFQFSGDGKIQIQNQTIVYRDAEGLYLDAGLQKIHQVLGAPWNNPSERLSLRFLEILDYVQDNLQGGSYTIRSGYRSPTANQKLRSRNRLAAQSSMHSEGAAADLRLSGVASSKVFDFVKSLNCCGIGWYHSAHFHLDTGPARFWDETSAKTEDKTPQENEKIILQTDFDRYRAGESVALKWMRVSVYPIGVPAEFELVGSDSGPIPLSVSFQSQAEGQACKILQSRSEARQMQVNLPKKLKPGAYALRVRFCNRFDYEKMPEEILSKEFQVVE